MRVRGRLAAVVVVSGLLLSLGAGSASAADPVRIVGVLGRNVPTYTSGPSKWAASAQGEVIGTPTKGEPRGLRGRAAVQESGTLGIKRVRIYDVKLQQLRGTTWVAVAQNLTDAVSDAPTAYAISVTPERRYCVFSDAKRSYRVVNNHAIRRSDDVVVGKVTYSKTFTAPILDDDPACPLGGFNAVVSGNFDTWLQDQSRPIRTHLSLITQRDSVRVDNVSARVTFTPGLRVTAVPAGFRADDTTQANDYVLGPESWQTAGQFAERAFDWTVRADEADDHQITATVTAPRVVTGSDAVPFSVRLSADVSVTVDLPTDGPYNQDVWPDYPGLQLTPGDTVVYRYVVKNVGPHTASDVKLYDSWDDRLGEVEAAWYAPSGDPAPCQPHPDYTFVCDLGSMVANETQAIYVKTHIDPDANLGGVGDNAYVEHTTYDPDTQNNIAYTDPAIQLVSS
jgi:hypothetical protein